TPYDTTHLGHAFINVIYDTLVRTLRWQGQQVRYVQNVTDIDDDILRKARELGMDWGELGRRETERYLTDLRALNVAMPTYYVRATDEIPQMVELTSALLARGHAYVRDGWVYFRVKSDPSFGHLAEASGYHGYANWLATANERGSDPTDPRKEDPLDFVLWQARQPGEPAWESPWGMGRPGWHIECSSMATTHLGPRIDIHGGGADLIFPHHTCEIAQSENATGEHPFVGIWMHCAMVRKDGEKMSKSLGNLVLVRHLLRDYSADAVRILLLAHQYRAEWEYFEEEMRRSADLAGQLLAAVALTEGENTLDLEAVRSDAVAQQARHEFTEALNADLDTPRALGILETLAARVLDSSAYGQLVTLRELAGVLGLTLAPAVPAPTSEMRGEVRGAE
ncbi:MAG: cysteine--tRNA ligase, partial [Ktedonobacterales bacterium]|nr:cysteine--tRNA ligase [Ktedonobacterales bacterium]